MEHTLVEIELVDQAGATTGLNGNAEVEVVAALLSEQATNLLRSGLRRPTPWDVVLVAIVSVMVAVMVLLRATYAGLSSWAITLVRSRLHKNLDTLNRRNTRSRGLLVHTLLLNAVQGQPVTYKSLRKTGRTRPAPQPPSGSRQLPPSLDVERTERPWRT